MSFNELGLSAELLAAVNAQGYTTPTPIQRQAIPAVIGGGDLMACAQTGTGKTAAFVLPILHRLTLAFDQKGHISRDTATPRVLVLVPTRELAAQVEESVRTYGKNSKVRSLAMFGGVGINPQIAALRKGVDILVATPGRLMDHMQQRTVDLRRVAVLILDEADRMLDMGFIRDMRKIVAALPKDRQSLMFSATFSDEIRELAADFLKNPQSIEVARRNTTVEIITQSVIPVEKDRKKDLLLHLFQSRSMHQALVFARTKHGADALSRKLEKDGIRSAALHGNKTQGARTRALAEFKSGKLAVLVATDIAARGIDIDELPFVINFELPNVPEDYVHRIGRTGRAGATGEAISLVCSEERNQLRDIERLIKQDIQRLDIPGFEADLWKGSGSPPKPAARGAGRNAQPGRGNAPKTGEGRNSQRPARPDGNRDTRRHDVAPTRSEPRAAAAPRAASATPRPAETRRPAPAAALLGGHKSGQRHK
jgi:ATP-dependent RNA helicase RhlE